jgi:hypothetical protein
MSRFLLLITVLSFSLLFPLKAEAADCTVLYGGGKIACAQPTPTVTPTPPAGAKLPTPAKTKGGLPVHSPAAVKTTPATGPEAFGLLGLIPAAAAGFWLRNKTRG